MSSQPGILAPIPNAGRYVTLQLTSPAAAAPVLERLQALRVDASIVVGLGEPLVRALGKAMPGLSTFPALSGPAVAIPSTQAALFIQARGDDHGATLRNLRHVLASLGREVRLDEDVTAFKHDTGRDLSGYEDGTENPVGDEAVAAAVCADGSSFVAAQRWVHALDAVERLDAHARDALIGRSLETNAELEDAPPAAHVKRTAQESFEPEAFMVRRSMPFGSVREHGLYFVSYVAALSTFERMLRRMVGLEDGIVDGLFAFSRPVSGGYYWCPPIDGHKLVLDALK